MNTTSTAEQALRKWIKNVIKENTIKVIAWIKKYWTYVIMFIICIVIFSLYMEYAMWIRVPRYLSGLNNFIKYVELEPIEKCLDYIKDYKLADFYVASSARSYLSGFQHDDYATEKATEKILRAGARFLDFEVYNQTFRDDTIPVVSTGKEEGNILMTLNLMPFERVCKTIEKFAFSEVYLVNYSDPLFINITLRTNNNVKTINKVAELIEKYMGNRLLGREYAYSKKNIAQTKLRDLIGKVIIFCDKKAKKTKLDELVNYRWGDAFMKEKSSIEIQETTDYKYLTDWNRRNITRVYPEKNVKESTNYNPNIAWRFGCQFVSLNYQNFDDNMKDNILRFSRRSFVLKPKRLRYKPVYYKKPIARDPNLGLDNIIINRPHYNIKL